MKTIKHFFYYTFIAISTFSISCDGEDGMDGIDGMDGTIGITGEDGNANVIASDWIPSGLDTSATTSTFFDVIDPIFTQEITDTALILVYGRTEGDVSAVVPIPVIFDRNTNYFFGVIPSSNMLRILGQTIDGSSIIFEDFDAFRYVIIPPNNSGRSMISIELLIQQLEEEGVDIDNYNEVATYYNLD